MSNGAAHNATTVTAANKTLSPMLQKALAKVTELGSMPEVTARIVEVVEDPKTTAKEIQAVVQRDPALATKILKIVNSAFYGLPSQIASLDRAILMLGLTAVKNLALATSLTRLMQTGPITETFSALDLWRHSVAVGVCSRVLATSAKSMVPDEAFVAGLVHDMGLIVAQQVMPDRLREVVDTCTNQPQPFCALEGAVMEADHQALGGVLAIKWKFPPGLRYAIAYHHEPRTLQPEFQRTAALVYVADTLCCDAQYGMYLTARGQELSDEVLALAGVTRAQISAAMEGLSEQVTEAEQIFAPE